MRSLRLRILRIAIATCLGLGLALPAGAVADGPPYSDGSIPDGVASCFGGPYDIVERDGDLYVRCWGGVPGGNWAVFTTGASLSGTSATVTVSRAHAGGRALIGYETRSGTATAGVDFTTTTGRLYFAEGQTVGVLTVPLAAFPPPPGTPARQFTVEFSDPVDLGLTVPTATVELPAVAASPDPGYPNGPPYATSNRPIDAEYYCNGGFYSLPTYNGDRYLWCLGSLGTFDWQRLSAQTVVGEEAATVTISRTEAGVPLLVAFATEADTAVAGRDFTAARGELYFATNVTSRTLTIPIVRDPAAGEPRRFALKLTEPVRQGLGLPAIDITIPGHPPTVSELPTVGGTARVGEQMTSTDGEWTHEPTGVVRTWERCDATGSGCVAIDGADDASYAPIAADVGSRLRVVVTATNGSGSDVARSASSAVVRAALVAPEITSGPSGSEILHRATFGFDGEDGATFECRLGDGAFAACTSPLTLTELPAGEHRFEVRQRASDGVVSDPRVREWTVLPSPDPEYPLAPPYGFRINAEEVCDGGAFTLVVHHGDRYARCLAGVGAYDWQRFSASADVDGSVATVTLTRESGRGPAVVGFETSGGTAVAGEDYTAAEGELYFAQGVTTRTLEIPVVRDPDAAADRSFTVTLRDTADVGLRVQDATVTIPGNPPTVAARPTVDGIVRVGQALAAHDGDWTHEPTSYARAWERCDVVGDDCVAIDGATGARYDPVAADVGARLRVTVTVANGAGSTTEHSLPTAVVRAALGAPSVTGGPEGETEETSAAFAFAGEYGATFECRRDDDGEYAACVSPVAFDGLGQGEHVLDVRQIADDGVVSPAAVRRWSVVPPVIPPGPDPGSDPPGPGPGDPPPGGEGPPSGPPPGVPVPPTVPVPTPPVSREPVRMTTVRMQLRFCAGCTRLSASDRRRLQRLRARVGGSRLLAIDGYGDRGRSRTANRKLARARARAVERALVAGVQQRPARRTVVGHARAISSTSQTGKRSGARDGVVTVRVVSRR